MASAIRDSIYSMPKITAPVTSIHGSLEKIMDANATEDDRIMVQYIGDNTLSAV